MARHALLRASDADRDAVAERLRQAAVEGRLEPDELEQRLHAALRARTYGELDRLLRDLPVGHRGRTEPARLAGGAVVLALRVLAALVVLSVVVVVVVLNVAWWALAALVWLSVRACHGCRARPLRRMSPRSPSF
jgi:hypothetical protein